MENFITSYFSSHRKRSFKSKTLSYNDLITQGFNFTYAGNCNVFICYSRRKYVLCCVGFTYDGENIFFSKNRYKRIEFNNLYSCIQAFHYIVNVITSSLDWFTPDYFSSLEAYNYLNEDIYK